MKKIKNIKAFIFIPAIVITVVLGFIVITQALIDDSNSVHIDPSKIENSTIIIGTHLIYIGAMNDSLYEVAEKSAEQSSQYNQYYKSELANGVWYDITNASSLEDITTAGKPVEDSVIKGLNLTHHTKSDGITYDLLTGEPVSVCNIISPYDLENMEELSPLKLQYDNLNANEDRTDTDERNLKLIKDFYMLDFSDKVTEELDQNLDALQDYYEILKLENSEAYMCDIVQQTMDKLDAERRLQVFNNMQIEALDNLIRAVSRNKEYSEDDILNSITNNYMDKEDESNTDTETGEEEEDDEDGEGGSKIEDFSVDNNLLSALSESLSNVEESYNSYLNKKLESGTTILGTAEYDETIKLIQAAMDGDIASCDVQVFILSYIDAINNGNIVQPEKENEYIDSTLLPAAEDKFYIVVSSGAGSAYNALPSTAAVATKQTVLKEQKAEVDKIRTELQFIIQAKLDRLSTDEAITYVSTLIENSDYYSNAIKTDDFTDYAMSSVDAYIQWLEQKLTSLQSVNGDGVMAGLTDEKNKLQQDRLEALDNQDLAEAKRLEAEIEAIDKAISDEEARLNSIINSDTATTAEKAAANASLGSSSTSGVISNLEKDVLNALKNGDYDGLDSMISSIGGLAETNPLGAHNALKNIYDELSRQRLMNEGDATTLEGLLTTTENVVSENIGVYTSDLSNEDFAKLIASILGIDLGGDFDIAKLLGADSSLLNASKQASVLAALGMYVKETGSSTAQNLIDTYAPAKYSEGNLHGYTKYTLDLFNIYAPTDRIARITGYRYIFNDSQKKAILQQGGTYYEFNAFSTTVIREKNGKEEMNSPAGYKETLYICEESTEEFGTRIVYLPDSNYGVILLDADMKIAEEIFDALVEAGGTK